MESAVNIPRTRYEGQRDEHVIIPGDIPFCMNGTVA
ncbi:hypothetical protein AVEN_181930-1, partial [Araneus ventricosus]